LRELRPAPRVPLPTVEPRPACSCGPLDDPARTLTRIFHVRVIGGQRNPDSHRVILIAAQSAIRGPRLREDYALWAIEAIRDYNPDCGLRDENLAVPEKGRGKGRLRTLGSIHKPLQGRHAAAPTRDIVILGPGLL
jgi:hypothetical protein